MKEEKKKEKEKLVAEDPAAAETEQPSAAPSEEEIKALREKAAALEKENEEIKAADKTAEYKDKWMRSVAEFDNYKKRNANLYREAYDDGRKDILTKVFVVGDTLERALSMELDEKTKEGVAMILRSFEEMLKSQNVTEINPVGEKFDPNECEAVMQAPAEEGEEAEIVKTVFQKGYKIGDKIVRYAKVSVTVK